MSLSVECLGLCHGVCHGVSQSYLRAVSELSQSVSELSQSVSELSQSVSELSQSCLRADSHSIHSAKNEVLNVNSL